jgi:deoxycytidine triphosphate deaminase
MAASPRIVANDVIVAWDLVSTLVRRGTIVDIPPGGPLEAAYGGAGNLVALGPTSAQVVSGDTEPVGDSGGGNL